MKLLLALLGLIVVASAMTDQESWSFFKARFGQNFKYPEAYRFKVFSQNLRAAEKLQAKSKTATYGITRFMDMLPREFRLRYANLNATMMSQWVKALPKSPVHGVSASAVDWRGKAVASVKDQEQCGSCWAFSAAAAMEGCAMLKNGGTEVDVSAQQIVDCCQAGGSDGCNGGFPNLCLQWATGQDMATWDSYPYNAVQGTCEAVTDVAIPAGTCNYVSINADEDDMDANLDNGVVSIAVDASVLQYYTGGIISGDDCSAYQIDHAILLVAWDGQTYTVKNSWGDSWGESGFFRMASGVNCLDIVNDMLSMALPN
jgi:cathepsin F